MNTRSDNELVIRTVAEESAQGRLHFGRVVELLIGAEVESYAVDYRAHRTTYHTADGPPVEIALAMPDVRIANDLDTPALQSAIRGAQRGEVRYPEFKQLSAQAGCIGYIVWIAGRHVTYFGRRGETHVERFPV